MNGSYTMLFCYVDFFLYCFCKPVPRSDAAVCEVINPAYFAYIYAAQRTLYLRERLGCGFRYRAAPGGGTVLVVYYADFVFFLKQSAHREVKVFASRAVDPAGAENQVFAAGVLDVDVSGEFGFSVDVERVGLVVFRPRLFFCAVEYVVG